MKWLGSIAILLLFVFGTIELSGQSAAEVTRLKTGNSNSNDFCAVAYQNGIVFCSNRKRNVLLTYEDAERKEPFSDIYYAPFASDTGNDFGKAKILAKSFASLGHDGPVCFNKKQTKIFFTRTNEEMSKKLGDFIHPNNLGIYTAELLHGYWKNFKPFAWNSPNHSVGHPSLSRDEKQLFFVSDKKGGYGGLDIYVSHWDDGNWSEPINLGPSVNTPGDELFPFIHPSGYLYFASNGRDGLGGLDIYRSRLISENWTTPDALEAPINSAFDDFGYYATDRNEKVFISSNRNAKDEIFRVTQLGPQFFDCDTLQANNFCYVFYEESSLEPDQDSLPLIYEWDLGDGTKIRALEAEHCYERPGSYTVNLNVIDTLSGDVFFNETSFTFEIEAIEQPYITSYDSAQAHQPVLFHALASYLKDMDIESYYWDFGDGNTAMGDATMHTYESVGRYKVTLGVISPIDSVGERTQRCVTKEIEVLEYYQPGFPTHELTIFDPDYLSIEEYKAALQDGNTNQLKMDKFAFPGHEFQYSFLDGDQLSAGLKDEMDLQMDYNPMDEPSNKFSYQFLNQDVFYAKVQGLTKGGKMGNYDPEGADFKYRLLNADAFHIGEDSGSYVFMVELLQSKNQLFEDNPMFNKVSSQYKVNEIYTPENETYSYAIGKEKALNDIYPTYRFAVENDFEKAQVKKYEEKEPAQLPTNSPKITVGKKKVAPFDPQEFIVFFDFNSHELNAASIQKLNRLSDHLKANPEMKLEITGHTDNIGEVEKNLELSKNRAEVVTNYLKSKGIQAKRLKTRADYYKKPIASNETEVGRRRNRRVDYKVLN